MVESIDNLICTLEGLCRAISARNKGKAVEAITLLLQQFMMTFGRATRIFLAILFLQTLKVHILNEEFEEASSGALALLARLRAVNTTLKQPPTQSAPTSFDASADDVLDDVMSTAAEDMADRKEGAFPKGRTMAIGSPRRLPGAILVTRTLRRLQRITSGGQSR
jgi:hypothetical protein